MNLHRTLRLGLAILSAILLVACADSTLPLSPKEGPLLSRGGRGEVASEFHALRRHGRVGASTVRVLITPAEGGTLSTGGVTLQVPAGAVAEPVVVQMTVPNGRFLFARFQPHGLQFSAPATLTFEVGDTGAERFGPLAGVYVGDGRGEASGRFVGLETIPAVVTGDEASFEISHFSGYIVASGRTSREAW